LHVFLKLKLDQKILSIIISIYININLFFERIKILSLIKLIFGKTIVDNYFFTRIGYDGGSDYFLTKN
jgi:hypothetical protein